MRGTGLSNNGGSRTLVRCCETLRQLGHDAFFYTGKSRYSWHKADIKCVGGDVHPPCDVSIATGFNSVDSVTRYGGRTAYFVRGFELWKASEDDLLRSYQSIGKGVFVNGEWLASKLISMGSPAVLQYSGLDWDWFKMLSRTNRSERAGVGALRNQRHHTKRSEDIDTLERFLGTTVWQLNRHIKGPDSIKLNKWYNNLKVWFAPTELEGLHNPPMEACMAGCALVCTDHPRSGMSDYAIHGQTALVYPARDIKRASEYVRLLLEDENFRVRLQQNMLSLLRQKIGTREDRMKEFASRLASL